MKRVLLTGASGFIGRQSFLPLLARGYEVHAVGRRALSQSGITWHAADLLGGSMDLEQLMFKVKPSHLLHFAWYAEHGKFWAAPDNFQWVSASIDLLREFADAGGKRVVVAGTCVEYDVRHGYCDESITPLVPATVYGICKNATRSLFDSFCALHGLSGAWGRIFYSFGPQEHPARLVASVARALVRDEDALCSHGRQLRDFLHVSDVAEAFVALLDSDVTGAVNIASGKAVSIADVAQRLAQLAGRPHRLKLGARPTPSGDPPVLFAATDRLQREVGWSAKCDLDTGLSQTLDWWRAELEHEIGEKRL